MIGRVSSQSARAAVVGSSPAARHHAASSPQRCTSRWCPRHSGHGEFVADQSSPPPTSRAWPGAMAERLFGVLGHQTLQFGLGLLMFGIRRTGPREGGHKLRPGIGRARVDNADRLDPWLGRLDSEQARRLALDTASELALGGDDEMLVERGGMGGDLDPLAAPGDHRGHRRLCLPPNIVLRPLRPEGPGQHELGLEGRPSSLKPAVGGWRPSASTQCV